MPIIYIVGPIGSGKSTLMEAFETLLPEGSFIRRLSHLGNINASAVENAVSRASVPHDKISFFLEYPKKCAHVLLAVARQYPAIRFYVTVDDYDIPAPLLHDMLRGT